LLASVALGGCADDGRATLAKARAQYERLVQEGRLPKDPAFDEVVSELQRVTPGSSSRAEAQRLLGALEAARRPLAPRPLARDGGTVEHGHEP
jgi:hypothetical protein